MLDDGRNNECGYALELVAFLYGECEPLKEEAFRSHLSACSSCSEELASLGSLRSNITLLREEARASKPRIVVETQSPGGTRGWFAAILEGFNQSRLLASAGALAVLVAVVSISLTISSDRQTEEARVANNTAKTETPRPVPTVVDTPSSPNRQAPVQNTPPASRTYNRSDESTLVRTPAPTGGQKRRGTATRSKEKAPTLSEYDEEESEDSLRLADLFEDIGD